MARTKGKGRPKYLPLQPSKTGTLSKREILNQGDQKMHRSNQKSQALQPNKTQVFKKNHLEPHPSETPSPTTPLLNSIVSVSSYRTVSISKTKRRTTSYYLNRKKLAALSDHFNPIPFVREKPSSFVNHRVLLARLGLWNFLHLDFGHSIHSELIKQFIVHYNPKKPANRRTHVNGCAIMVGRAAFARALSLPSKRLNLNFNGTDAAANTGPFVVSDEEAAFLDELVCSWLVLQDDGCELPGEVSKVEFLIKEKRLEEVDWAGLIWFMVRRELLKGVELVNCHYASHMQLLLKNQKPQLFVDHTEIAKLLNAELASSDAPSGQSEIVKEWEKERILDVGDSAVVVEESSSRDWETESIQGMCGKWGNSSPVQCPSYQRNGIGNKLQEPQNLIQDHNVVGEVSGEKFSSTYQQTAQLKLLSVDVKDDEIKSTAEDLFPGNSGEFPDGQEKKKSCEGKLADLEFGSSSDMIINEHCCDKRLKVECSGDFTAKGMHVLSKLESQFEQMDLHSDHDNGEKEFSLDDLVENCRSTSDELCTLNELHTLKTENSNKELKLLPDEDKRNLTDDLAGAEHLATKVIDENTEVLLLHHEDARKLSEGSGKGEIFDRRTTDNLIDSQEEEEVNNDTEGKQMDYNQQQLACFQEGDVADLESVSANNMVMNEESNNERLKVDCSSNLSVSGMLNHGRLETNFHQMDLIIGEDISGAKCGLNVLMEDQNATDGETFTLDDRHAIKTEDGNKEVLQNELPEESEKNKQFEIQEKKVGNSLEHDTEMGDGDYEKEFSQGQVKDKLFDAGVGVSHDRQEVEICFSSEKYTMDDNSQHTEISMQDKEPETSDLNDILGTDMVLQNKNTFKSSSFVEPFVLQREISFSNFHYSPMDKSLKREIDCLNDRQLECQVNVRNYSAAGDESFDMDYCSKQVELWMSRLKNVAAKMDNSKYRMLLKELETKNQMIQISERRRLQEQHKYQKTIYRLEREVYLMNNILDEYRTALNEIDKSFSEYRKRAKLPDEEEPIYVDHPDGGGEVVLARELISSNLKLGRENQ